MACTTNWGVKPHFLVEESQPIEIPALPAGLAMNSIKSLHLPQRCFTEDFQGLFAEKEELATRQCYLVHYRVEEHARIRCYKWHDLLEALGSCEITVSQLCYLIGQQKNGEDGPLTKSNSHSLSGNCFFLRGQNKELIDATVFWEEDQKGWTIFGSMRSEESLNYNFFGKNFRVFTWL